jgi:hypothetical protein
LLHKILIKHRIRFLLEFLRISCSYASEASGGRFLGFSYTFSSSFALFQINHIFLKDCVKGDYTNSYKILVYTRFLLVPYKISFGSPLQSHVVPRAQRAAEDFFKISRHLITLGERGHVFLRMCKRELYKVYDILSTMTLIHHVSDFFYILLASHALLRPQGAGQDFMTYSRH